MTAKPVTAARSEPLATGQGAADSHTELELYLAESRQPFRIGRISLLIGVAFLGVAVAAGEVLAALVREKGCAWLRKESLVIGGWVALWRPLEIFLYDWWPRLATRLHDRPSEMDVRVLDTAERGVA
ncbi:MAG: hypothetical protein MUE59_08775 [Thiobacillaceae bacterium]|nr:hypothetical protein [Thiobacillaceae bacterium]